MTTYRRMVELIEERLAELGISQVEFARMAMTRPSYVNAVLRGRRVCGDIDRWAGLLAIEFDVSTRSTGATVERKPVPSLRRPKAQR